MNVYDDYMKTRDQGEKEGADGAENEKPKSDEEKA